MNQHQTAIGKSQNRFTPRWLWEPLGPFASDVCTATRRPWSIGSTYNLTPRDDAFRVDWRALGRKWCNPPFLKYEVGAWVRMMCRFGDGVLLLHVRTETEWFRPLWEVPTALLFLARRVIFCRPDGSPCIIEDPASKHYGKPANSGAPVVLAAFGMENAEALRDSGLGGAFVPIRIERSVIALALEDRSWPQVVRGFLADKTEPMSVAELWDRLRWHVKAKGRPHARAQLRKVLQQGAGRRVGPDQWMPTCA